MGHYRSEMISQEEWEEEQREFQERDRLTSEGILALKEIFGERAVAVAYLLHTLSKPRYEMSALRFAEEFKRREERALTRPEP